MKKEICVVLLTDKNYLFACGTFILNLKSILPNFDNIIIFSSNLSYKDFALIGSLDQKILFCNYTMGDFLTEFCYADKSLINVINNSRYPFLLNLKIKIFDLLNYYRNVIYFDLDMLLLSSIKNLVNTGYNIIWRNDKQSILFKLNRAGLSEKNIKESYHSNDLSKITTPNGGFFIVNDNFDFNTVYKFCVDFYYDNIKSCRMPLDEIMFGYIGFKFSLKIFDLDKRIYNVFPLDFNYDSVLLHFLGGLKPWKDKLIQLLFPQWMKYYMAYCKATGEKTNFHIYNYGNLIQEYGNSISLQHVINITSFPKQLVVFHNLFADTIKLKYSQRIFFEIKKLGLSDKYQISLYYSYDDYNSEIKSILKEFKFQQNNTFNRSTDKYHIFFLNICNARAIQRVLFDFFYESIFLRSELWLLENINSRSKIKLKSFFSTYLTVCDSRLCCTSDVTMSNNLIIYIIGNNIILYIPNEDSFITYISQNGYIDIGKYPAFFQYFTKNKKICISISGRFLSARNDNTHSINIQDKVDSWEEFFVEQF